MVITHLTSVCAQINLKDQGIAHFLHTSPSLLILTPCPAPQVLCRPLLLNWDDFAAPPISRGHVAMSGDIFSCHSWKGGAPVTYWVDDRGLLNIPQ